MRQEDDDLGEGGSVICSVVCTMSGPREPQKLLNPPYEIRRVLWWSQVLVPKEIVVPLAGYQQLIVGISDN